MENKIGQDLKDPTRFTNIAPNNTFEVLYIVEVRPFCLDRRANNADIITVTLEENITLQIYNETFTKSEVMNLIYQRHYSTIITNRKIIFPKGVLKISKGGTTQKFTGTGTAGQNNTMNGTISVTVVRFFTNGNL